MYRFEYVEEAVWDNKPDTVSIVTTSDMSEGVVTAFFRFMLAAGFDQETIAYALAETAEKYLPNEDEDDIQVTDTAP